MLKKYQDILYGKRVDPTDESRVTFTITLFKSGMLNLHVGNDSGSSGSLWYDDYSQAVSDLGSMCFNFLSGLKIFNHRWIEKIIQEVIEDEKNKKQNNL